MSKKNSSAQNPWRIYFTWPLLTIFLLEIGGGLPLALTASTLTYWLAEARVDKAAIGLFAAAAIPYTLKFLWSPLMDSLPVPLFSKHLGRRRGWILAMQLLLITALLLLACARPDINPWMTALCALFVAFASASQDIVIDAYRVELLTPETQGQGAAMAQLGYRTGILLSTAGALYFATYIGWQGTYCVMAGLLGIGIVTVLCAREPNVPEGAMIATHSFGAWLRESVINPFVDFTRHPSWWLILIFIVVYKLADAFIGPMTNPFFVELGFQKIDIANIVKIYGTIATLAGTFLGGAMTARYGAIRILFLAGFLHAFTNLLYVLQVYMGADTAVLSVSIAVENLTGGISAAAFVAFLSGLCNVHYTATQYALLSSLAAFGRTWLATPAGFVAKALGWEWFFTLSALLALPGLLILGVLNKRLKAKN